MALFVTPHEWRKAFSGIKSGAEWIGSKILPHPKASPQAAPHVAGRMTALMSQACAVLVNNDQSAVCSIIADKCPNLQVTCGNQGTVTMSCDVKSAIQVAKDVLQAEPPEVLAQLAKTNGNYLSTMESEIASVCSADASAKQRVLTTVTCSDSDALIFQSLNAMDSTSACATSIVMDLIAGARTDLGEKKTPPPPPLTNQDVVLIAGLVTLGLVLLFLGLGLATRIKAHRGGT